MTEWLKEYDIALAFHRHKLPCEVALARVMEVKNGIYKRMIEEDGVTLEDAQNTLNELIWAREKNERRMFDEAQAMLLTGKENA